MVIVHRDRPMRTTRFTFKFFVSFVVISVGIFGGWPALEGRPLRPIIKIPLALALDTGWKTAGSDSAVGTNAGDNDGFETTPGNTTANDSAYAESVNTGTAASSDCSLPNTDSDQHDFAAFGISLGVTALIKGIEVNYDAKYDSAIGNNYLCFFLSYDGGTTWTAGKRSADIDDTDVSETLGSNSDTWGRVWSNTELNNSNFKIRVMTLANDTARAASLDYLAVKIHYNLPPDEPTLDSPANTATNVSTSTVFKMTATDPDSDNVAYKLAIFSDNACSTVEQLYDQTADHNTCWSGQDVANGCTDSVPASYNCYSSGAQGTCTIATPLAYYTQYWWQAAAWDMGTKMFTTSTPCNTFTTVGVPFLTFSVSPATLSFPLLSPGTVSEATTSLNVDTNNASGFNITIARDDSDTALDDDSDATNNIIDKTNWASGASCAAAGNATVSTTEPNALQFRVRQGGTAAGNYCSAWWGSDDTDLNALFAGLPATAQKIVERASASSPTTTAILLYNLSVPITQKTGSYSGNITFTATANP